MDELYRAVREGKILDGKRAYTLYVFGNELAKRNGYKVHKEMDAVDFFLVEKYRWLPSVVKSMTADDKSFLLSEEMAGWTLPAEALPDK